MERGILDREILVWLLCTSRAIVVEAAMLEDLKVTLFGREEVVGVARMEFDESSSRLGSPHG